MCAGHPSPPSSNANRPVFLGNLSHSVVMSDVEKIFTDPITDDESFMKAQPAKQATIEAEELLVPTDAEAGEMVQVEMGGLVAQTHYYVAVRPIDACAGVGPIMVSEKICSNSRGSLSWVEPSSRMPRAFSSSTGSPWPGRRSASIS